MQIVACVRDAAYSLVREPYVHRLRSLYGKKRRSLNCPNGRRSARTGANIAPLSHRGSFEFRVRISLCRARW